MIPETLGEYVRRIRNEKNISTQKVAKLSKGGISDGYVSRIENGLINSVTVERLQALAKGLGVPEDEIFAVARGAQPAGSPTLDEIMSYLNALPASRQRDILMMAKVFFEDMSRHVEGVVIKVPKEAKFTETSLKRRKVGK